MRYKNIRIYTEVERENDTVLEGNDYFAVLQISLKKGKISDGQVSARSGEV